MELKKTIKKILKEQYGDKFDELKKFVVDQIYFEEQPDLKKSDRIEKGFKQFVEEYGFMVKRYGMKKAFIEYMQGLPSWLDIPFYYDDIQDLLYSLGFDEVKDMDSDELAKYWYDLISDIFIKPFNNV